MDTKIFKRKEKTAVKPVVVIPAFNPDEKLITLVGSLKKAGLPVVVVDDGSQGKCLVIFNILAAQRNCEICRHSTNRGKGAALKTGIRHGLETFPATCGFVTADADGQHRVEDILKVARTLEENGDSLILGVRNFKGSKIPFNSKWGNRITSLVYLCSTGQRCVDTQTGLRGIPSAIVDECLQVKGEHYEFEMNLLLSLGRSKISMITVPIDTIYIENNRSSHFHPFWDSIMIYYNIVKYSFSSLISAATDLSLFTIFLRLIFERGYKGILFATVAARLISGGLNFMLNKHFVFKSKEPHSTEARHYMMLFCCQMMLSWGLVSLLSFLPLNLTLIKIAVDGALFFASYQIQKKYIFKKKGVLAEDEKFYLKTI